LIRGLGALFPKQLDAALDLVHTYQRYLLVVAVLVTAAGTWKLLRTLTAQKQVFILQGKIGKIGIFF